MSHTSRHTKSTHEIAGAERAGTPHPRPGDELEARRHALEVARLEAHIASLQREIEELTVYRDLAYLDCLTGLHNRRYFDERLQQELARASRLDSHCSLVVLDIDDFKLINDELGHPTGDLVLRAVGRVLEENRRAMDVSCRIGGDELAVILPETDAAGALSVRTRLEEAAARALAPGQVAEAPGLGVTLSFGTATFPAEGTKPEELVALADREMYAAKRKKKPIAAGTVSRAA